MDNTKEEHLNFVVATKKEKNCSPIIRVARSYHPKNVLMTLCDYWVSYLNFSLYKTLFFFKLTERIKLNNKASIVL